MKTLLEKEDISAIAAEVAELLKPLLKGASLFNAGDDVIFDVQGLANYLKVEPSWVYKQVSHKAIPYFKNGKYTRFKKSIIDKWIEKQTVKPIPYG